MKKVIVIGSVNTDLVVTAPVMPRAGETVVGTDFFTARGGKGANQAVAAARLGAKTVMGACVGRDSFGAEAIDSLKKEGVDVEAIRRTDGSTGTAVIVVSDGNNRIILDRGTNTLLRPSDVDAALEKALPGDVCLTQLENPVETVGYCLKKAKGKGLFVILNPAPADRSILPYLKYCDLVTPNETESELLGGTEELLRYVPTVLTTLGANGFEIATAQGSVRYPCRKIVPVDTTAAGDTLCGGLAARLSQGFSLEEAALFGSAAASLACTKKGAQPSIPTLPEVIDFLK